MLFNVISIFVTGAAPQFFVVSKVNYNPILLILQMKGFQMFPSFAQISPFPRVVPEDFRIFAPKELESSKRCWPPVLATSAPSAVPARIPGHQHWRSAPGPATPALRMVPWHSKMAMETRGDAAPSGSYRLVLLTMMWFFSFLGGAVLGWDRGLETDILGLGLVLLGVFPAETTDETWWNHPGFGFLLQGGKVVLAMGPKTHQSKLDSIIPIMSKLPNRKIGFPWKSYHVAGKLKEVAPTDTPFIRNKENMTTSCS